MADVVELQKLKLAELKQECAARGLDVKGNKSDLIGRLQSFLEEPVEVTMNQPALSTTAAQTTNHKNTFPLAAGDEVNEEEVLGESPEVSFTKDPTSPVHKEGGDQPVVPEKVEEKKVVKIIPPVTTDQKLNKRAERFHLPPSADSKKEARAARFGMPSTTSSSTQGLSAASSKPPVNVEALKKRAERFGMNVSSVSKKVEEDEKLKKRKERFGILTSAASVGAEDSEAKKRKRAERFGNV